MHIVNLLLPDFMLILFGAVLFRVTKWHAEFWIGMEKLIYYVPVSYTHLTLPTKA